jgi:hypothetical protein
MSGSLIPYNRSPGNKKRNKNIYGYYTFVTVFDIGILGRPDKRNRLKWQILKYFFSVGLGSHAA